MIVLGLSMWYADAGKHLADRAYHLFAKQGIDRWLFGVRPAPDCTPLFLARMAAAAGAACDVLVEDWEQQGERLARLSLAGSVLLEAAISMPCDAILWHESDLFTPPGVVSRLAAVGGSAVGGWPVLAGGPSPGGLPTRHAMALESPVFYDTWGYRKDGVRFTNTAPHHDCVDPSRPFQLDSVGSVVLLDAEYIRRGARMNGNGLVGLCDGIRSLGGTVWCDPTVPVIQPLELWTHNDD